MAYSQHSGYADMAVAFNGQKVYEGVLVFMLVPDNVLAWEMLHPYGGDSNIIGYSNPDFAVLETSYSNSSIECLTSFFITYMSQVGDYIDYYNTNIGNSFCLRFVCTQYFDNGSNKFINCQPYIIFPGGSYTYAQSLTYYQISGTYSASCGFNILTDPDTGKASVFRCYRSYDSSAVSRSSYSIHSIPFMQQVEYNLYSPILYAIFANGVVPPTPGGGPYGDDDYTESVGGDGDHDETSDTIDTSPIPIAAATRSGMVTAFVPTWGEIQSVADALLDPNIFQILSSTVVRAADVIIGLSTFPCTVPATNTATVTANFLGLNIGTGVVAHVADDQYLEVPCGELTVNEYWGNCLDYNPYTSVSIFLPFCGMYELDVDEVMGKTLNVSYRVDIFSGACLATIKIDGSVFYQYTGQCSSQIPLNSVSFDNFLSSMLDIGIATATGVAAVKGAAGAVAESEKAFSDAKSSEAKAALEDMFAAKDKYTKVKENSGANMLNAAVSSVIGGKGMYSHAGAMGGSPGFLAVKTPFLIIKRPEQIIPSMYGKFHGYPSNTTANLGDLTGYTVVSDIRLNIPEATVDEIIECEQLLKGGVVL